MVPDLSNYAHKIQILDKSDEQRFVPQLPAGVTNDNEDDKARKTEDLLTTFSTKKRTPNKFENRVLESYAVYLNKGPPKKKGSCKH